MQISSQEKLITGIVTSYDDGIPITGVNVIIKGSKIGTTTDFDGKYKIKAKEKDVLVFSYLGFVTQMKTIGTSSTINVSMDANKEALDEVVIVGYGSTRKSDLTGSVSSYKPSASQIKRNKQKAYHNKLANQIQSNSVANALQGKVAGVNVTTNNGALGTSSQIRIRGVSSLSNNSQPLVIIDGVVSSYKKLEQLIRII